MKVLQTEKERYRTGSDIFTGSLQAAPRIKKKNTVVSRVHRVGRSGIIIINYAHYGHDSVRNSVAAIRSPCKLASMINMGHVQVHDLDGFLIGSIEK